MKNSHQYILFAFLLLFGNACEDKNAYYEGFEQNIIVDGSIETGGYPKVILTRNIPYYVNIDSSDMIYLVLRQAKVTVSDGKQAEVLTLKYDENSFPPFYYEGNELRGKAGGNYQLTIDYGEKKLTATTTIPQPVSLDSLWFQPLTPGDSLGKICASLHDYPGEHNYYRTFTQIKSKQTQFYATLISNFDDRMFDGLKYTFYLNKGPETYLSIQDASFYFNRGDTILFKISTVDASNHAFWQSYQNEVANGANPFASSYHKIESNISGGGKGIWGGYGSTIYQIIAKE